ncbi:hypothetical protein RC1_2579 [Rhodospirillum centenum SW]|uniref:Uncharacterized protein n=1 Tax=Rhodospirillum centenum (strain ATCC 51521 / SW) TaxID=414684 RepID=B6IU82_RHOCS|nr:hypothetical protein RC1_2579 [Rhodospirillum centenum SW]
MIRDPLPPSATGAEGENRMPAAFDPGCPGPLTPVFTRTFPARLSQGG